MLEEIQGQIDRITYRNDENGYTIAKFKVRGRREPVTVLGNFLDPAPGEILKMQGEWTNHPRYGEQFKMSFYEPLVPATVEGIERYLGSGLIRGLGPVMAKRIVKVFGKRTLDVIENEIERLAEVEGIGEKRVEMIRRAWEEQKEIREVMIFLQSHGVGPGYATRIFRHYGREALGVVKENPYRMATDIHGIGFLTADRIAEKLGVAKDSPLRAEAGILHVLSELAEDGHVYYPYEPLIKKCLEILQVDREVIVRAFGAIAAEKKIVIEDLNEDPGSFVENLKAVYLAGFHLCETNIAARLKALTTTAKSLRIPDPARALEWVKKRLAIDLAEKQAEAIAGALRDKVMVITGGPGTGKTTLISALLQIAARTAAKVLLAAPTGRAAKRMSEATGREAKTIHRLLEYSPQRGAFQRNDANPLECDLLVVDEASMIDTLLMHHLLKAVPFAATLILVGDAHQLPSVGPGSVFRDIIESNAAPVVELNEIFRQSRESRIIVNAHRINEGQLPLDDGSGDFFFIEREDPEEVLKVILELARDRIPRRFGFDPLSDVQVLTPMNRGIVGTANLNLELQKTLNPREAELSRGGKNLKVGDKVMQIRNNYDKEVFNGDIGRIVKIDREDQETVVLFDGRAVVYDFADLDEIVLAYAVSVHKSQGSEYPAVIIPVLTQHYVLLQRNLIYTAVTRGKKLVVLVGTKKALAIAVKNNRTQKRYTGLRRRLAGS
jgi:exodeoxyribonuclease V alpha subunit